MIEPRHRDMVLRMSQRGLPATSIHHAMRPALRLEEVQIILAERDARDRQLAAAARKERAAQKAAYDEHQRKKAMRKRLKAMRDQEQLKAHFRVITIRPVRRPSRKET